MFTFHQSCPSSKHINDICTQLSKHFMNYFILLTNGKLLSTVQYMINVCIGYLKVNISSLGLVRSQVG